MSGQGGKPVGRTEADKHEFDRGVVVLLVHLNQVLLARQSMPVTHEHHDMYTG